ncbi:hypothetical protein QP920_10345 [Corynebacterium marquesiae]|uniref:hypothetical protein n=1 Tax=Corynebacterium marquesiae TaxID=2913503 RepID=UPI00254E7693|nr:hypothetical protein [Corynebacterium marquesiae]MDK8496841.1 hypothetical protein [Corynebacterium marquesiae]
MRKFAQIQIDIWNDTDFRNLTPAAQHLFFVLLSHPSLNHAGVGDWRPARLSGMAHSWAKADVEAAAGELVHERYVLIDDETEEFLIRSYVRNDALLKQPRMATAVAKGLAEVGSSVLRGVVIFELRRLHDEQPELKGWGSREASRLLDAEAVDPSTFPLGKGSIKGSVRGSTKGSVKGSDTPSQNDSKGSTKGSDRGYEQGCPIPSTYYLVPNTKYLETCAAPSATEAPEGSSPNGEQEKDKPTNRYPDEFETWWSIYPRKKSKRRAYKRWQEALKRVDQQTLNERTQAFADHVHAENIDPQYIKYPEGWLAGDGWDDELIPRTQTNSAPESKSKSQRYIELGERMARELEAQEAQKPQPTGTKQLEPPF